MKVPKSHARSLPRLPSGRLAPCEKVSLAALAQLVLPKRASGALRLRGALSLLSAAQTLPILERAQLSSFTGGRSGDR